MEQNRQSSGLAEVLADHLDSHIASLPLVTIELHSSQTLQIRQMLTQLIRWKPLLPVTWIDLPQRLRYLPRTPGILTNPHNLNIHLSSSQYPEYLLLRQFRLAKVETHAARSIRRTRFGPFLCLLRNQIPKPTQELINNDKENHHLVSSDT